MYKRWYDKLKYFDDIIIREFWSNNFIYWRNNGGFNKYWGIYRVVYCY